MSRLTNGQLEIRGLCVRCESAKRDDREGSKLCADCYIAAPRMKCGHSHWECHGCCKQSRGEL